MSSYQHGLQAIPRHMHDAVIRYIDHGIRPGHFLTALFSNDLMEAFGRADESNTAAMREWVGFVYNYAPTGCHGSPQRVADWIARGGLNGLNAVEPVEADAP